VLSVPREAIQGGPANRHVFVKHMTIPNAFDRVSVQTGLTSNDRVEIIDGLLPADEVVTRGAYSLGYAGAGGGPSLKEAMDAAHGHEHNKDGSEMTPEQKASRRTRHGHARDLLHGRHWHPRPAAGHHLAAPPPNRRRKRRPFLTHAQLPHPLVAAQPRDHSLPVATHPGDGF
jgi:hypothetical protein